MKRPLFIVLFLAFWTPMASAAPQVQIDGVPYIDVNLFMKEKGLGFDWDAPARNLTISGGDRSLKLHVGSEYVLNQSGRLFKLDSKVRMHEGFVAAPVSLENYLKDLVVNAPIPQVRVIPAIENAAPTHQIRKIVLDAGHGGEDLGATYGGVQEKDVTLEVVKNLRYALVAAGLEVVLTRDTDVFIPLDERSVISNKAGADLFISIHANASETKSLRGFEVYTLSEATDDQALALERAENEQIDFKTGQLVPEAASDLKAIFWELRETENRRQSLKLAAEVAESATGAVKTAAQRARTANFRVLKKTESPAILVEIAYLSNDEDRKLVQNPLYKHELTEGLVKGILNYKKEYEENDGFTR